VRFSSRRVAVVACLALAATLAPSTVRAGEDDAKTLFAAGRELRAAGKCEDAIVEFRRALEVYPEGLGSLRNIAECEEHLGKYAAARRDWWDLRRAVLQTNEAKYDGWDKDAETAYARLAPKVARVTVKLKGEKLERVKVAIDGKPLDPRLVGVELERDLGPHTVEGFYGGAAPVTEKVTLAEGGQQVVMLAIPAPSPGDTPPAGPIGGPSPHPDGGSGLKTAGFVALGIGGVGAIGTVVAVIMRQSALASIKADCPNYETDSNCPNADQGDVDRGKTASLLVNVFGGVAIAGIGVGVGLLIAGSSSGPKPAASSGSRAWLGVTPAAGGAQARAGVSF